MQAVKEKSPLELFIEQLQAQLASNYSQHHSEAVKRGMKSMVAQGYMPTRPPVGYQRTLTKGLFEPTKLGVTLGTIVQGLAKGNIKLPETIRLIQFLVERQTDNKMSKVSTIRLIGNPYYAGILCYQGERYLGKHIALITTEQHEEILRQLNNSRVVG